MEYGMGAIGGTVVGMPITNMLVLSTSVGDFDMIKSNLSSHNVESCLELSEEPEYPLILLTTYSDYLVQVESLTSVV